jgi:hypothetical protein
MYLQRKSVCNFKNSDLFCTFLQWLTLYLSHLFSDTSVTEIVCNQKYHQYESHETTNSAKSEIEFVSDTQAEMNILFIYDLLGSYSGVNFSSKTSPDELTVNTWCSTDCTKSSS